MHDEIALKNALKFATIYGIRNPSTCHSTHYIYQKYNEPNILLLFFFLKHFARSFYQYLLYCFLFMKSARVKERFFLKNLFCIFYTHETNQILKHTAA